VKGRRYGLDPEEVVAATRPTTSSAAIGRSAEHAKSVTPLGSPAPDMSTSLSQAELQRLSQTLDPAEYQRLLGGLRERARESQTVSMIRGSTVPEVAHGIRGPTFQEARGLVAGMQGAGRSTVGHTVAALYQKLGAADARRIMGATTDLLLQPNRQPVDELMRQLAFKGFGKATRRAATVGTMVGREP
jgi:hypothetical protein